jgi:uncharacterized protein (DUF2267 family)
MSQTGLTAFDSTLHTTNTWIGETMEELGGWDRHRAYQALRSVLHALRDRLSVEQTSALGAQLPMLVRGLYYEGWHPHGKPLKERKKEEFLAHVATELRDPMADPEGAARAVFAVLARHVSGGEVETIKCCLPAAIRELWP